MKDKQKGFIVPVVIIVVVLAIGGGIYYFSQKPESPQVKMGTSSTQTVTKESKTTTTTETPTVKEVKSVAQDSAPVPAKPTAPTTTTKTTPPAPVAPKKNIYTNTIAGYSIELPDNWLANINSATSDPNEPEITGTFLTIKGQTADQQGFSFDIQTSTTKRLIDYHKQQYDKTPTYDDLFNVFVETQKSLQDEFVVQSTRKTVINGNQAYEVTAKVGGGGGTEKLYAFYTAKNTYYIQIIGLTSKWSTLEPELLKVVASFKIQ